MSPLTPLLIAFASLGALAQQQQPQPATQPASPPANQRPAADEDDESPEAQRQDTLEEIAELKSKLPVVAPGKLSDLLSARITEGFLLIELKQAPEEWPFLLPLEGQANAVARVTIVQRPRALPEQDSPPTVRFSITLDRAGAPDSKEVLTKVELTVGGLLGQLNMTMNRVWTDGTSINITLIQLLASAEDQPGMRLHISRTTDPQEPDLYAKIEAETFVELAHNEPELFEEYVRPMLVELGISSVLDTNIRDVAMQAFLGDLPVDDATRAAVDKLLVQLDAADFAQREAAQAQLQKLGRPAATALANLLKGKALSPEQTTRARSVLLGFEKVDPRHVEAKLQDPQFLRTIAQLKGGPDDEALASLAQQRLEKLDANEPSTAPGAR